MKRRVVNFTYCAILILFLEVLNSPVAKADLVVHCTAKSFNLISLKFKCLPTKNGFAWKRIPGPFNPLLWSLSEENQFRVGVTPNKLCFIENVDFQKCLQNYREKFVLVIGDSQVASALNLISFLKISAPVIVSSIPACPPLDFKNISQGEIYDESCRTGAKNRISNAVYKRVSSVMIISGGRYSSDDLDAYLELLSNKDIKNILFVGPYVRSDISMSNYIENLATQKLITKNFQFTTGKFWERYSPNSQAYQPDYFEKVTKFHNVLFINPFEIFCKPYCPIFISNHPILIDTHHWSFSFSYHVFLKTKKIFDVWAKRI
jgi:hypothetical protein